MSLHRNFSLSRYFFHPPSADAWKLDISWKIFNGDDANVIEINWSNGYAKQDGNEVEKKNSVEKSTNNNFPGNWIFD